MNARALLLAAGAALALAACEKAAPPPEAVRPVLTMTVQPGASSARDTYSGEIRARHESDLSFRVGGKLAARLVDAGARVKRGQVLARLDPGDARLAQGAAGAQLASAEGDLALARAERDRHAELLAKKFISQSAFDARENAFNAARARVEQARAQAALSANQSAYTALTADADGVVVSVAAEPGQVVAAGQPILRLAQAGELEVLVNAPEGQVQGLAPGQEATLSLWAEPARPFRGRVREIAGGADPATRTYAVRVTAIDPPPGAKLGMTATVAFAGAAQEGLVLLPPAALVGDREQPAVWVLDPATGRVKRRAVRVGQYREDGVTVTSGLAAGDVVVTAGAHKLREDQAVRRAAPL